MDPTSPPAEWLRGFLSLAVLRVMADGPSYGYAINTQLSEAGVGEIKGGTLYPLLARLEAAALVTSSWQAGDGGPGRKFFELTELGRDELDHRSRAWASFARLTTDFLSRPIPS